MTPTNTPKAYSYIRFSTLIQKEDHRHSLPRQLEKAEQYAEENNLELVSIRDLGISGYSGAHIHKGELATFLQSVHDGEIAKGSKLLIESIDRLTRLKPSDAQSLLIDILKAGVSLVILDYGHHEITLKKYNNDPGTFYQLMGEIQRAYSESKRKSELLINARKREREQARNGIRKITGMTPMWLELNEDNTKYKIRHEVVEVIQLMFEMKRNGKGTYTIEKELNQMEDIWIPTHARNKSNAWGKSTINRYLKDKRLIGEYQPHRNIKKPDGSRGREKVGDVIPDYYPEVIDRKLFFQVQEIIADNAKKRGYSGGKNDNATNLFTHIATCGYCGSALHFMNKGKWHYLQCDSQRRELGCTDHKPIRYDEGLEPFFIKLCKDLNPADILPGNEKQKSRLAVLQNQVQALNGELNDLKTQEDNLLDSIAQTSSSETRKRYDQRLHIIINNQQELEKEIDQINSEIGQIKNSSNDTRKRLSDIWHLIDHMESLKGQELIDLRKKLKLRLRQLILNISIKTGETMQITIQFLSGQEMVFWIDKNGRLDVYDSDYNERKQRLVDRKVAKALIGNRKKKQV